MEELYRERKGRIDGDVWLKIKGKIDRTKGEKDFAVNKKGRKERREVQRMIKYDRKEEAKTTEARTSKNTGYRGGGE